MATLDFNARQLALIKSARSLEQDSSREADEKINDIWPLLTAAKGGKSCAAEETILRWLLKHMDGTTATAEQLRRYPLVWTILGCLFERISLFSLSKIFIERRFIAVLHQSAKDISRPQKKDGSDPVMSRDVSAKNRKRKRGNSVTFDLGYLQSPEAIVESASELFGALRQLMSRLSIPVSSATEDAIIGAEHVKALFRTPAIEAQELAASLLWICCQSLGVFESGLSQDQRKWIEVLTDIWDLHRGSAGDPHEFAARLYYPCCSTLLKLQDDGATLGDQVVNRLWAKQLEQLLMKNLINPARIAYSNSKNLDLLEIANDAMLSPTIKPVEIMWSLAVRTRHDSDDSLSKKAHISWAQGVFALLLLFIQNDESGNSIISSMLDIAIQSSCPPDVETLRGVCRKYALQSKSTDWPLLSKIIRSDCDVFLLDEDILSTVFTRITTSATIEESEQNIIVDGVINPLMKAFSNARNLTGFVKKWHHQSSQLLEKSGITTLDHATWFDFKIRHHFAELLQGALSVKQLTSLLDWLEQQDETNGASIVILDAICSGITEEDFINAVNLRLFEAAFRLSLTRHMPKLQALKWRIAGVTSTWVTSNQTHQILENVKSNLNEALRGGVLSNPSTFEAFSCCIKLCLAAHPSAEDSAALLELTSSFLERIVANIQTETDVENLSNYLHLAFSHLPRLNDIHSKNNKTVLEQIGALFHRIILHSHGTKDRYRIHDLPQLLLENPDVQDEESSVDILLEPIIDTLESSGTLCGWTQPKSVATFLTLLSFPREVYTRDRRKRIMTSWKKWRSAIGDYGSSNEQYAEIVLRFLILIMQQPTFYNNMAFEDLLGFSTDISRVFPNTLPLVEKLVELLANQILEHNERDLQTELRRYVESIDVAQQDDSGIVIVILKSIVSALKRHSTTKSDKLVTAQSEATQKLLELVERNISQYASKLKKTPSTIEDNDELRKIDLTVSAVDCIRDEWAKRPFKPQSKSLSRLQSAGELLTSQGIKTGWKLKTFLLYSQKNYDLVAFTEDLSRVYPRGPNEQVIFGFVDAVTSDMDPSMKLELLYRIMESSPSWKSPEVPYLAIERVIDTVEMSTPLSMATSAGRSFDLAALHVALAKSLIKVTSVEEFGRVAKSLLLLLEKHSSLMTQVNIEVTLSTIATVCSSEGPKISNASAAGEILDTLYRLVATIIKRHRLRVEGHYHLLVTVLQALLRVVLADPTSLQSRQFTSAILPPWLDTRLKARHAAKFTRLLTLTCEPSAASVARWKNNPLDSATDAVKRSAGQHTFRVLVQYIKLQLEGYVSREIRKALEPGIYSVLSITPESGLKILNESMDASGRAIFRRMYSDYKKFGKWSGI